MSAPIIGSNIKLEIQSTLGSPITISGITLANPGVATSTAHGLSNGATVVFTVTSGMSELDGQVGRVANKATDTFEIEGLDTSAYTAFVAGTCASVTAFVTFDKAQTVAAPNAPAAKVKVTTLHDKGQRYVFDIPDAPAGAIGALFNPGGATEAIVKAASQTGTARVVRLTYADSRKSLLNAFMSFGDGFTLAPGAAATTQVEFTPVQSYQPINHYTS